MINDKLLAKFEGKCWHERENQYGSMCRLCGATLNYMSPINPSYSTSPDDRERLWGYLMRKKEMCEAFFGFYFNICFDSWDGKGKFGWSTIMLWLSFPLDGVPRWVSLLSDWLRLDETVERFGWVTCPSCKEGYALRKLGERTEQTIDQCQKCNGSGRVRAEWAKYAKEGK